VEKDHHPPQRRAPDPRYRWRGPPRHGYHRPVASAAAWAEQFTAAAIQDPTDVCRHLFAPALAAVFKGDTGRTCLAYYGRVDSRSYRIRHRLQDGPSAAIEGQVLGYGRRFGYFTILLTRLQSGWQAIDIVPGGSVRPR
jgi:hypothetical protein